MEEYVQSILDYQKQLDRKERIKKYRKQWRLANKEKLKNENKQWNLRNKEKRKEFNKKWTLSKQQDTNYKEYKKEYRKQRKEYKKEYDKNYNLKNKEYKKEYSREYNLNNKNRIRQYLKSKRETIPEFNLLNRLRSRVYSALKYSGARKSFKTMNLIGCTIQALKEHLEKQFKEGMSWEDRSSFHIDHIIPCSKFDLTLEEEEQKKCFHYTNLQPLYPIENLQKSNKVI